MDAGACGPAEPEEADGDAEYADESRREAFFRCEFAVFVELRFHYLVEVVEEWRMTMIAPTRIPTNVRPSSLRLNL